MALSDIIKKAGVDFKRNVTDARTYFSTLQNIVNASKGHEHGAFKDAYKRMGGLLQDSPSTFTEYYSKNRTNLVDTLRPEHYGKLIMFRYNAKMRDTLPYWDRYPLVMPIERNKKGHLVGLNFHYLHPNLRAGLLDRIVDNNARNAFYEKKRIRFNYGIMQRAAKSNMYAPCVKQYIMQSAHIQTKFLIVPPEEYKFVLFLPLDMFQKKSREFVWAESVKKALKEAHR